MENEMIESEIQALEQSAKEAQAKRRKSSRRKKGAAALALLALFAVGTYAFVDWSQTKFDVNSAFGDTLQVKLVADWEEATTPWTSKFVSEDLAGAPLGTIKKNTSVIYEGGSNAIVRIRFMEFMQSGKDLPTTEWRGGQEGIPLPDGNSRWADGKKATSNCPGDVNTGNNTDKTLKPSCEGQRYIVGTDGKFVGTISNGYPQQESVNTARMTAILADLQAKYDALWTQNGAKNTRPALTIEDIDWFVPGLPQVYGNLGTGTISDTTVMPGQTDQTMRYGAWFIRDSALDPNGSVGAYLKYFAYTNGSFERMLAPAAIIRPVVQNSSKLSYEELDPNNCDATSPCETDGGLDSTDSLAGPNNDYDQVDWATDADAVAHGYVPYIHDIDKWTVTDGYVGTVANNTVDGCKAINDETTRNTAKFNISMADYNEKYGRACAETVFRQYVQFNLNPNHYIMYSDWDGNAVDKWIIDDTENGYAEGWMYWGNRLTADKAIADTQILNSQRMIKSPSGDFQYSLFVSMQAVDDESLGKWEDLSDQIDRDNAATSLGQDPGRNDLNRAIYDETTGTCGVNFASVPPPAKNSICDETGWQIPTKVLQQFRIDHVVIDASEALDSFGQDFILPGATKPFSAVVRTSPRALDDTEAETDAANQGQQWSVSAASSYGAGFFVQDTNGGISNSDVPGVSISGSGSLSIATSAIGGTEFWVNVRSIIDPSKVASYKMTVGSAVGSVSKCTVSGSTIKCDNPTDDGHSRLVGIESYVDNNGTPGDTTDDKTVYVDAATNTQSAIKGNYSTNTFYRKDTYQLPSKQFKDGDGVSWRVLKEKDLTVQVGTDSYGDPITEDHKYALITTNFADAFKGKMEPAKLETANANVDFVSPYLFDRLQSGMHSTNVYSGSNLDKAAEGIYGNLNSDIKKRIVPGAIGNDANNAIAAISPLNTIVINTLPLSTPPTSNVGTLSDVTLTSLSMNAAIGDTNAVGINNGYRKVFSLSAADALTTPLFSNSENCKYAQSAIGLSGYGCSNMRYPSSESKTTTTTSSQVGYWLRNKSTRVINSTNPTNGSFAYHINPAGSFSDVTNGYSDNTRNGRTITARPALWIQID